MAPRSFVFVLTSFLLPNLRSASPWPDICRYTASPEEGKFGVFFRSDNCSSVSPQGRHAIHEVSNVSFTHLACHSQAAAIIHWSPSPLGIEHVKGFRVYLGDKEGRQCQQLILREPRQLNFSYKATRMSSQSFSGLTFDTDYMVRVVPFPTFLNDSFFHPFFLRTNSCEVLLGPDNLVCKPFWRPRTLDISQVGSSLQVVFDHAPSSFGFTLYFLFYKLRQDGPAKLHPCKPEQNLARTTCVLQDVSPGTYTIELRDISNMTRRHTQYHVSQVHSPWAGPIRAMAITVPLVVLSAFATLFTVMCRKKQQENIYSQLDEESSESSSHSAGLSPERPWPRPKVFLCYSNRDGPKHTSVIQSFAYFLQDYCGCEVVLDLWDHLEICKEGQMSWLSRRLDEADYIITVCSKALRYYVERKSRRGKTPVSRRGNSSSSITGGSSSDLFIVGVAMIAEKLRLAQQSEGGGAQELARYMAVYFDYSSEKDVPTMLSLAPRFKLMDQLPQLFSRLHSCHTSLTEAQPPSRRNYFRCRAGRSLYVAICNMHQHISQCPDWFERQLAPSSSTDTPTHAHPSPSPSSSPSEHCCRAGLALNQVVVTSGSLESGEGLTRRNLLLLDTACALGPRPHAGTSLDTSTSPTPPPCSLVGGKSTSRSSSRRSLCPTPPTHPQDSSLPTQDAPPPRDSGIYDSSVPSSELSIPLMEGLAHDQADSASLADSQSSSSGLGDEEPPTDVSLLCTEATVCKAQFHQCPLEPSDGHTPVAPL